MKAEIEKWNEMVDKRVDEYLRAKDEMSWIFTLLRNREELSDAEWKTLTHFFKKGIDAEFQIKVDGDGSERRDGTHQ